MFPLSLSLLLLSSLLLLYPTVYTYYVYENIATQYLFGRLDLSNLFSANETYLLNVGDSDTEYTDTGVSLSFYLDPTVRNTSDEAQTIISLYGSEIKFTKRYDQYENFTSSSTEVCLLSIVTQYKVTVNYTFNNCDRKHVYLDLYQPNKTVISQLYENLEPLVGDEERGWCGPFEGFVQGVGASLRPNYSYASTDYTLDFAKERCIEDLVEGETCRAVTLMNSGDYNLRPGDYIVRVTSEQTWMTGPCTDTDITASPAPEIRFHRTDTPLELSHINVHKLGNLSSSTERTERYKRVELGSMVVGDYLNFADVTYNLPFNEDTPPLDYIQKKLIGSELKNPYTLNEGSIIQEGKGAISETGNFIEFNYSDEEYSANFIWVANNLLYIDQVYCKMEDTAFNTSTDTTSYTSLEDAYAGCDSTTSCWGISYLNTASVNDYVSASHYTGFTSTTGTTVWYKGFCLGDNIHGTEVHRITTATLTDNTAELEFTKQNAAIYVYYFRSLPTSHGEFEAIGDGTAACNYSKGSNDFTENVDVVFSFTTEKDGIRIWTWKTDDKSDEPEQVFVSLNATEHMYYVYKMSLGSDVQAISLLYEFTFDTNDCSVEIYTRDTCDPEYKKDNYGEYFVNRLEYSETQTMPCFSDSDSTFIWTCNEGELESEETCPFYQCYESAGRQHNDTYVDDTQVGVKDVNEIESGDCCGGKWTFTCEENYSVNYSDCHHDCLAEELLQFSVSEADGSETVVKMFATLSMTSGSQTIQACESSIGNVTIGCNCTGNRYVVTHTCLSTYCLLDNTSRTIELGDGTLKYGDFDSHTLEGPFNYLEDRVINCTTGGNVTIKCGYGNETIINYAKCVEAPSCNETEKEVHPLKGNVTFDKKYATETDSQPCGPSGGVAYCYDSDSATYSESACGNATVNVTRLCDSEGVWQEPDHSMCPMKACANETFTQPDHIIGSITFSTGETAPGHYSSTSCAHEMCNARSCGRKRCNATTGEYDTTDFSTCMFSCTTTVNDTSTSITMLHGSNTETFDCTRSGSGDGGKRWLDCNNMLVTNTSCKLKTCSYDGSEGCIDLSSLSSATSEELVSDLSSFAESADLSSPEAQETVAAVVNELIPTSSSSSEEEVSLADKAAIAALVDMIAVNLAKTGGAIESDGVNMYGVPATEGRKRSVAATSYLTDNGIDGSGFNGSIGISVYTSTTLFTPQNTSKGILDSSSVKSITTEYDSPDINITIKFDRTSSYDESNYTCRYYNTTNGNWSVEGCSTLFEEGKVSCTCSHLTSFAVLVSLSRSAVEDEAQNVATQIMLTISLLCLAATVLAILPFRKLRSRDIMKIHLNLIVSDIIASASFLMLDLGKGKPTLCYVLTFITHFGWLAVFFWMVGEGFTMYRQTVQALKSYGKKVNSYVLKLGACVYGGALIFPTVGVVLGTNLEDFNYITTSDSVCFLDNAAVTLVPLFLAPLYLILICSIYFFARVSYVVVQAKKSGNKKDAYWKKQLRAVVSIATVTGIAWIIAPFLLIPAGDASVVLQWIFVIVLGLQGVVVFIVQVVLADEVKSCWFEVYKGSTLQTFVASISDKNGGVRTVSPINLDDATKKEDDVAGSREVEYMPATALSNGNKLTGQISQTEQLKINKGSDVESSSHQDRGDEIEAEQVSEFVEDIDEGESELEISEETKEGEESKGNQKDSWVEFVEKVDVEEEQQRESEMNDLLLFSGPGL